jgi:hypothetical protein
MSSSKTIKIGNCYIITGSNKRKSSETGHLPPEKYQAKTFVKQSLPPFSSTVTLQSMKRVPVKKPRGLYNKKVVVKMYRKKDPFAWYVPTAACSRFKKMVSTCHFADYDYKELIDYIDYSSQDLMDVIMSLLHVEQEYHSKNWKIFLNDTQDACIRLRYLMRELGSNSYAAERFQSGGWHRDMVIYLEAFDVLGLFRQIKKN